MKQSEPLQKCVTMTNLLQYFTLLIDAHRPTGQDLETQSGQTEPGGDATLGHCSGHLFKLEIMASESGSFMLHGDAFDAVRHSPRYI